MRVIVGMATFKGREKAVDKACASLSKQVDLIYLYDNEQNEDLTDNGKFYGLELEKEPCIYLSCDDDLLYPPDYVENMVKGIEIHNSIVSHHGRILKALDVSYYHGHKSWRCLDEVRAWQRLDVCGTGVTGFSTEYFNPTLWNAEDKKMSDLVFSLEAIKQVKTITLLPHAKGWIKHLSIPHSKSIAVTERNNTRQIELANEIYNIRNGNKTA